MSPMICAGCSSLVGRKTTRGPELEQDDPSRVSICCGSACTDLQMPSLTMPLPTSSTFMCSLGLWLSIDNLSQYHVNTRTLLRVLKSTYSMFLFYFFCLYSFFFISFQFLFFDFILFSVLSLFFFVLILSFILFFFWFYFYCSFLLLFVFLFYFQIFYVSSFLFYILFPFNLISILI